MTTYHFEFAEDGRNSTVSVDLADDDAARREALRTAREYMAEAVLAGVDPRNWVINVRSEEAVLLFKVGFSDIVHP